MFKSIHIVILSFFMVTATSYASNPPSSFADMAEQLLPTVVNISSTQKVKETQMNQRQFGQMMPPFQGLPEGHPFDEMFNDFFNQQMPTFPQMQQSPAISLGSGFVFDKDEGLIITNNHVIDGADEIIITLHDKKTMPAMLLAKDEKTDLAILKADLKNTTVNEAQFGNSGIMRVGDWVLAIGNPFGLGGTVTAGIISARQRDIQSGPYDDYLQTDASINQGNSGGPMFNMDGQVIGINTAIFSPTGGSVGIGFAIPSDLVKPIIDQLQKYGRTRRGWLGVKIQDVTEDIAKTFGLAKPAGALVSEVTPTGPAEKAGIKSGDIILAFDNKPVREMRNLPRIVAETDISKDVPIVVWRQGKRIDLTANVGELEKAEDDGLLSAHDGNSLDDETQEDPNIGVEISELGLTLNFLTDELRETFGASKDIKGAVVMDADVNSDAASKGIDVGDIIIDINQKPVTSLDMIKSEISNSIEMGKEAVLLLINRQGNIQFVAVKIKKQQEKPAE